MHTHHEHPDWSYRRIGAHVGATHRTVGLWLDCYARTGDVKDQERPGRKPLVDRAARQQARQMAIDGEAEDLSCSAMLAETVQGEIEQLPSDRTLRRVFRGEQWLYGLPKPALVLTAQQKQKRLTFAKRHLGIKTAFSKWMFTDSKVFQLHKTAGKKGHKVWYLKGYRPTCRILKASQGVHVYAGVTKFGVTKPIVVTGGGSQKSAYINPKTGILYPGVSAVEYQHDVVPKLIKQGNQIFAAAARWPTEWVFQQDNATPHTAKDSKRLLTEQMPGRVILDWPPNSPDLSWIENIWAWVQGQIDKRYKQLRSIEDLMTAISEVFKTIPKQMLRNRVRGMHDRLRKVIDNDGDVMS